MMIERNVKAVIDLVCRYEGCGSVSQREAGLAIHQKWTQGVSQEQVVWYESKVRMGRKRIVKRREWEGESMW